MDAQKEKELTDRIDALEKLAEKILNLLARNIEANWSFIRLHMKSQNEADKKK